MHGIPNEKSRLNPGDNNKCHSHRKIAYMTIGMTIAIASPTKKVDDNKTKT